MNDASTADEGTSAPAAFTTGLAGLDGALAGDTTGLARPGDFWLLAGGTGHGKTALVTQVFGAMLADMVHRWGLTDACGIYAHTEDVRAAVLRGAGLTAGQVNHAAAGNARVVHVGSARQLTIAVYDAVMDAVDRAAATGRPLKGFLPRFVVVDFFDDVEEDHEHLAALLRDGIAAWDPDAMAAASGLHFTDHAGYPWPEGMDAHRVAVLAAARVQVPGDRAEDWWYQPARSDLGRFVALDADGAPLWDVLDGDAALPAALRAPEKVVASATGVVRFHRSQPNTQVLRGEHDGSRHLADTRARVLVSSAVRPVRTPVVPLRYDVDPGRPAARYFDEAVTVVG